MFLKNEKGELVNINKIVAVRPFIENYCPACIHLHTKNGNKIRFKCVCESDAHKMYKDVNELLIRERPRCNQRPWINEGAKWIEVDGNMFLIEQIECILVEGWVVSVHMENTTIEILNHNDEGLRKCLKYFEVAFKGIGHIINLDGWKAEE